MEGKVFLYDEVFNIYSVVEGLMVMFLGGMVDLLVVLGVMGGVFYMLFGSCFIFVINVYVFMMNGVYWVVDDLGCYV